MEPEESKISVWVCREEKLVLGLSKRTTCADVVQALLEDQRSRRGRSAARSYRIAETWRGLGRVLPSATKILRLWAAWGAEQGNVEFVLVKGDASPAERGARSAEARVVPSRRGPRVPDGAARSAASPEKRRRAVRRAFRKWERIRRREARAAHGDDAERMETLVHVVASQDRAIRQQARRVAELDAEIDAREAKVHLARIKANGVDYVQDSYLADAPPAPGSPPAAGGVGGTSATSEERVRRCAAVARLERELWEQEALIETATARIREELNRRWMQRRGGEPHSSQPESASLPHTHTPGDRGSAEEDRIKTQLDASWYIGLRLDADLRAIRNDLELSRQIYSAREKEMRDLLEKVNRLDVEGGTRGHGTDGTAAATGTLEMKCARVEQARGPSKDQSVNDEDSDTGLSSLHSQDSDHLPVWESLV